ncbi:Ribonuclease P protein subunit p30 [Podochytrium sp. JEL0797]|nr:Ribonuclease P protein subunit p30 [Podochytrium sp. JEL0797]
MVLDDANLNLKIDASNQKLQHFDILAVKPETEKAFVYAAQHADIDVIQLNLAQKLPFYIKKTTVNMATQRGIFFEVSYGPCIRDSIARANIIANIQQLLRVTGGKHIIISSDAMRALDIRSPQDVQNLAQVFGIPDKHARDAVSANCRSVLFHADTMKGFVSVEPLSSLTEGVKWKLGAVPTEDELKTGNDFVSFGDLSGFE